MTSAEINERITNQAELLQFNQENFPAGSFGMGGTGTIFRIVEWLDDSKASAYIHKTYSIDSLKNNEAEVKIISAAQFNSTEGKAYKFLLDMLIEEKLTTPDPLPGEEIIVEDTDDEIPDDFFDDDSEPAMTKVERDLMERAVALDADRPQLDGLPIAEAIEVVVAEANKNLIDPTPEIVDDEIPEAQEIVEGLRTGAWEGNLRSKASKFYDYLYWHGPVTSSVLYDYMKHLGITKTVGTKADALALVKELNNAGWDARNYEHTAGETEWGIGPYCEAGAAPEYVIQANPVIVPSGDTLNDKLEEFVTFNTPPNVAHATFHIDVMTKTRVAKVDIEVFSVSDFDE